MTHEGDLEGSPSLLTRHGAVMNYLDPNRKIYVASRSHNGGLFLEQRRLGAKIISTWIDEWRPGQTSDMRELWVRIQQEIENSTDLVLYVPFSDSPWKGAFVEVGMAIALQKPIIVTFNFDASHKQEVSPEAHKIVGSWLSHPSVHICSTLKLALGL